MSLRALRRDEGNGPQRKMTLTARLAIAMMLLVAIAVSAVGWLGYRDLEREILPRVLDRTETHSGGRAFRKDLA
jgi:type VI protein secretion system component VasF